MLDSNVALLGKVLGVLLSIGLLDQKKKMVKILLKTMRILCNMTHRSAQADFK